MNHRKLFLAGKALLAASLALSPAVHAAELWSTDLWSEESGPEDEPPARDGRTNDAPADGGSPGGRTDLWSEELWSDDLWNGDDPNAPPPTPEPSSPGSGEGGPPPERPSEPAEPDAPAAPADPADAITMQIGSAKATVRGVETELSVPPFTINGRAMIPLRFIGEALHAAVQWSESEQKVTIESNGKRAELWVNRSAARLDGRPAELDFPPAVLNGTTLVPLRFVGEFFGYQVDFEEATQTITIVEPAGAGSPEPGQPATPEPPAPTEPAPEPEPPAPTSPEPGQPDVPQPPPPEGMDDVFGRWELRMDGRQGGILMGGLIVNADGTYGILTAGRDIVTGTWRPAEKDEIVGQSTGLILENGPDGVDWALIPKRNGIVSVRYQQGYTGQTKIWFEYSLGVRAAE